MKIVVFGANGQVGTELRLQGAARGDEIIAVDRASCDLTKEGAAASIIARAEPGAVINAAAYNAVDKAESETALAIRVNAGAPGEMARAAARLGASVIHFSTDYVFDGAQSRPYRETDAPAPLGAYGRSKLEGERAVAECGGPCVVIRTSWVFSQHGGNFVKTMLKLARERDRLSIVDDQTSKPTPAASLAEAALAAAKALTRDPSLSGLYHFAGDSETTRADFARVILARGGLKTPVDNIKTNDFPAAAKRPHYSALDTGKFTRVFGLEAPSWRAGLEEMLAAPAQQETH